MLAKRHHLLVATATLTLGLFGSAANAADIFSLTSKTFKDGTMMPKNAANSHANAPTNANCVGENVSPEFSWTGVPEGTTSFAFRPPSPALPRVRSQSRPTNMSAARAPKASASIPAPARRPAPRRTTIRSCSSLLISIRRNCRPA